MPRRRRTEPGWALGVFAAGLLAGAGLALGAALLSVASLSRENPLENALIDRGLLAPGATLAAYHAEDAADADAAYHAEDAEDADAAYHAEDAADAEDAAYHAEGAAGDASAAASGCLIGGGELVRWDGASVRRLELVGGFVEHLASPTRVTYRAPGGGASITCSFGAGEGATLFAEVLRRQIARPQAPWRPPPDPRVQALGSERD